MYTSYDVARQLLQIRNYVEVHASGFAELPKDVLSAMLHLTAEYRNAQEMEMLIQMGADPHEKHGGFTVLEMFVQGHDGYWCDKDRVKEVEDGVKMLTKYGVTCEDLTRPWILKNCGEIINNSEYLGTFFKVEIHEAPVPEVGFVSTDQPPTTGSAPPNKRRHAMFMLKFSRYDCPGCDKKWFFDTIDEIETFVKDAYPKSPVWPANCKFYPNGLRIYECVGRTPVLKLKSMFDTSEFGDEMPVALVPEVNTVAKLIYDLQVIVDEIQEGEDDDEYDCQLQEDDD